jgi:hypothetical protein
MVMAHLAAKKKRSAQNNDAPCSERVNRTSVILSLTVSNSPFVQKKHIVAGHYWSFCAHDAAAPPEVVARAE